MSTSDGAARRRRQALLALTAVILLAATARSATANAPSATGWWWTGRPFGAFPALSPVPAVPERGLYVGNEPSGPIGISALRFELDDETTSGALTLDVAEAMGQPIVDACATADRWEPAHGGSWEDRPEADCEAGPITGSVAPDGKTVSFEVASLEKEGVLDIVLVPGADPSSGQPATFSVSFQPVGPDALSVARRTRPGPPPPEAESSESASQTTSRPVPDVAPPSRSLIGPSVADQEPPSVADHEPPSDATTPPEPFPAQVASEVFEYPAIFLLPLALLCGGALLGWALIRPASVRADQLTSSRRSGSAAVYPR